MDTREGVEAAFDPGQEPQPEAQPGDPDGDQFLRRLRAR